MELKAIRVDRIANDFAINADRICRGLDPLTQKSLDVRWRTSLKKDGYRDLIDKLTFKTPIDEICKALTKAGFKYTIVYYEA